MAKILIFVLKYSINYVEIIKYKGGIKMAEINQESGVFGGISFENNMNQSGVVENAGTIRNEALPVKTGFWQKLPGRSEFPIKSTQTVFSILPQTDYTGPPTRSPMM